MARKTASPDDPPEMTKAQRKKGAMEYFDDTPVAIPVRFTRQQTLTEQIRNLIRSEAIRAEALEAGFESFEDADDFDVGDDYDPRSPHELSLDQELESYGDYRDQGWAEIQARNAQKGAREEEEGIRGGGESSDGSEKRALPDGGGSS